MSHERFAARSTPCACPELGWRITPRCGSADPRSAARPPAARAQTTVLDHWLRGTVPLTLVVEGKDGKKETVEVKAPVKALNAAAEPHKH